MSCDNCGKDVTGRFLCINGGALLQDETDKEHAGMDDRLDEFMSITTHDDEKELYKDVDIVPYNSDGYGQFEWYFCNKKCLKEYFTELLDKVEDINCKENDND